MRAPPSERLTERLEREGFSDVRLYAAKGAWRTNVRLDVYRWEGSAVVKTWPGLPPGLEVTLASWDTMTDCARHGIVLTREVNGAVCSLEVSAKTDAR